MKRGVRSEVLGLNLAVVVSVERPARRAAKVEVWWCRGRSMSKARQKSISQTKLMSGVRSKMLEMWSEIEDEDKYHHAGNM